MELVERGTYLAALGEHLDAAAAAGGRLVLVGGEAGVGKTSLVRRFADEHAHETRVRGGMRWSFTPEPLAPLRDLGLTVAMSSLGLVVEEAIEPMCRADLHARALQALVGSANEARLGHHAERAGDANAVLEHARTRPSRLREPSLAPMTWSSTRSSPLALRRPSRVAGRRASKVVWRARSSTGRTDRVARAYGGLGFAAVRRRDWPAAERWLNTAIRYTTERDLDGRRLYLLGWRAASFLQQGRWHEAAADAAAVLSSGHVRGLTPDMALRAAVAVVDR